MFKFSSRTTGDHPAFEYPALMANSEACAIGEALVQTNGRLTKAGAAETPEFIAMQSVPAAASPSVKPAVVRVDEQQEWETAMGAVDASPAAIVPGSKLTLHTDGLSLSYVTASGVFTVSGLANTGNAVVGDKLTGYFRR